MPEDPEVSRVMAVLDKYFQALEDGTVDTLLPSPTYEWRFWKDGLTLERMRRGLENIDDYLNADSQHGWAERNYPGGATTFDGGPDLNRLPDAALVSMFIELDSALASSAPRGADKPEDEGNYNL